MLDLDHFKSVNDTYGHDAGDAVLIAFSKILKEEARNSDIVGRFGGEEFLAILGDTDLRAQKYFVKKYVLMSSKPILCIKGSESP
jgi:diguanylate cyclase